MIQTTLFLVFFGFALIAVSWYYRLNVSSRWITSNQVMTTSTNKTKIFTLIPVLDEVGRIEKTVEYFLKSFSHLNHTIVLITTGKEPVVYEQQTVVLIKQINKAKSVNKIICTLPPYLRKNFLSGSVSSAIKQAKCLVEKRPDTIAIVKELAKHPNITHFHYPYATGNMAHQLNYAIKFLNSKPETVIYALYNADSRPDPRTFDWVLNHHKLFGSKVFQQYGSYLKDAQEYSGWSLRSLMLLAAAAWQTRWSIGFEMYHALKQYRIPRSSLFYPLNYCIGHGLFFTPDIYKELDGFSEDTHNEDALFGLELSYLGITITPVPYFDLCETPRSIKSLYLQKSNWYYGPLQAFTYVKKILKRRPDASLPRLFLLTLKLFSHSIYWVVGPTLFVIALLMTVTKSAIINVSLLLIIVITFFVVPNKIAWDVVASFSKIRQRNIFLKQFIGAPMCYIFHGLSAYRTIMLNLLKLFTCKEVIKQKTPSFT